MAELRSPIKLKFFNQNHTIKLIFQSKIDLRMNLGFPYTQLKPKLLLFPDISIIYHKNKLNSESNK